MSKKNKFDKSELFVKKRLLLEEPHFSEQGINEFLIICRAWEIKATEDSIRSSITQLIDKGYVEVIKIDEKGIRHIRWAIRRLM